MNTTTSSRNVIIGLIIIVALGLFFFTREGEAQTIEEKFASVMSGSEKYGYVYDGYAFVRDEQEGYITRLQVGEKVIQIPLHFGPREVKDVTVGGTLENGSAFTGADMFITFEPNATPMKYITVAAAELSLNLNDGLGVTPHAACAFDDPACEGRPILTCANTDAPVLYLRINEDFPEGRMFFVNNNCIVLEGSEWGVVKAVDYFLLKWYRII